MLKWASIIGGWQSYAAIAAICFLLGGTATWRVMSWREQAQVVKTIVKTITQIKYQDRVTEKIVTKYLTVKAAAAEETRNRIEDVPNHVTPEADAACSVPLGFVWVWNNAVHQSVPDASGGTNDTASGLACSDIAKAFVEAAGRYDDTARQLVALQNWVTEQRLLSEAPR